MTRIQGPRIPEGIPHRKPLKQIQDGQIPQIGKAILTKPAPPPRTRRLPIVKPVPPPRTKKIEHFVTGKPLPPPRKGRPPLPNAPQRSRSATPPEVPPRTLGPSPTSATPPASRRRCSSAPPLKTANTEAIIKERLKKNLKSHEIKESVEDQTFQALRELHPNFMGAATFKELDTALSNYNTMLENISKQVHVNIALSSNPTKCRSKYLSIASNLINSKNYLAASVVLGGVVAGHLSRAETKLIPSKIKEQRFELLAVVFKEGKQVQEGMGIFTDLQTRVAGESGSVEDLKNAYTHLRKRDAKYQMIHTLSNPVQLFDCTIDLNPK